MTGNRNAVFNEVENHLKNYFRPEQLKYLMALLGDTTHQIKLSAKRLTKEESIADSEMEKRGLLRIQIDRLLTFAEIRIPKESFINLAFSLIQKLIQRGEYELAEEISEEIMLHEISSRPLLKADAYMVQARIAWLTGEWSKSRKLCKKAYLIFTNNDNLPGMSNCENLFSNIYAETGDIKKARIHLENALNLIKHKNYPELKAKFYNNLGIISDMADNIDEAKSFYSAALVYSREIDDNFFTARLNHNLGMLNSKQKNYKKALEYFDTSINISRENGYFPNCAISFIGKAYIYSQIGKEDLSAAFAEKAYEIAYKINDRLSIADVYRIKGIIMKNLNNINISADFFENSMRLNNDFGNKYNVAEVSSELEELQKAV